MKRSALLLVVLLMLLTTAVPVESASFTEHLKKLAHENARGYINPFVTAFGTGMNSGLYHTAKIHGWLGFDLGVRFTMTSIPDDAMTYDFYVGETLSLAAPNLGLPDDELILNPQNIYPDRATPTMFGKNEGRTLIPLGAEDEIIRALQEAGFTPAQIDDLQNSGELNNLVANIPSIMTVPGVNLDVLPLMMPQVSVGLPMKTEVMLRYFPEVEVSEEIGKFKFMGLGVKHSISQYIPLAGFLIDITGQFAWQKLEIGDILEATNMAFNLHASRKLGIGISLTPYVGIGYEISNLKINYTIDTGDPSNPFHGERVSFDLDGDNGVRLTGGVRLGLALITINADYSLGEYNAASLGIGLTLR